MRTAEEAQRIERAMTVVAESEIPVELTFDPSDARLAPAGERMVFELDAETGRVEMTEYEYSLPGHEEWAEGAFAAERERERDSQARRSKKPVAA